MRCRARTIALFATVMIIIVLFYYGIGRTILITLLTLLDTRLNSLEFGIRGDKELIPKIIHQLAPPKLKTGNSHSNWQKKYPDYTCKLWNDSSLEHLVTTSYPWLLSAFKTFPYPIQRADVGRYLVLYHDGGFYADLDCFPHDSSIDELCKYETVVVGSADIGGFSNWFLGAQKNSQFLELLLQGVIGYNQWCLLPYMTVVTTTGPVYFTRVIQDWILGNKIPCWGHVGA